MIKRDLRRRRRLACAALFTVLAAGGCQSGEPPRVSLGDPAPFTAVHLIAAEAGMDVENGVALGNGPFTAAHLKRYFESKAQNYDTDNALRMDQMLDAQQQLATFIEALQANLTASVTLQLAGAAAGTGANAGAGGGGGEGGGGGGGGAGGNGDFAALQTAADKWVSGSPSDSPFDRLDRVADFFTAYVIKQLRVRGDSRVIDQDQLVEAILRAIIVQQQADPDSPAGGAARELIKEVLWFARRFASAQDEGRQQPSTNPLDNEGIARRATDSSDRRDRLLVLVFQAQVDAGTNSNEMASLRVQITGARQRTRDGRETDAGPLLDRIRVIRVHPTHTYDVQSSGFGQGESRSFSGSVSGQVAGKPYGVNFSASNTSTQQDEARRQFISHLNKTVSWADATQREFGFNFYPSNFQVVPSSAGEVLGAQLGLAQPGPYQVKAFLESGARDCAVMIVLPRNITALQWQVSSSHGDITPGHAGHYTGHPDQRPRALWVQLPEYSPWEAIAATFGAGPTLKPATATTQPAGDKAAAKEGAAPPHDAAPPEGAGPVSGPPAATGPAPGGT